MTTTPETRSRAAMLARLREALRHAPTPPERTGPPCVPAADAETLLAGFLPALDAVGVTHAVAASPEEAASALGAYLRNAEVDLVAAWDARILAETAGFDVHAALAALDLSVIVPSGERPCPGIAAAQAGITGAFAALSGTGTVVVTAGPGMPRSVSIVPPIHVALVKKSRILPGLATLFADFPATAPTPSAIHAISGVSSTGDIEFVSVRGVHGPVAVHVIVLDWM